MVRFDITGIEPSSDPAFAAGGPALFRAFYAEVVRRVVLLKGLELAAGLDKNGRSLRDISPLTRLSRAADVNPVTGRAPYSPMGRAYADAPPLQSTGAQSRTRSLFRGRVTANGAEFFWANDPFTGLNWGDVLAHHARGFFKRFAGGHVRYVPPRDVIGLSPQSMALLKQHMQRWWIARRGLGRYAGHEQGLSLDVGGGARPEARAPKGRRAPAPKGVKVTAVPTPTTIVYHTRRPPEARVPAAAGDFTTAWRQVR